MEKFIFQIFQHNKSYKSFVESFVHKCQIFLSAVGPSWTMLDRIDVLLTPTSNMGILSDIDVLVADDVWFWTSNTCL